MLLDGHKCVLITGGCGAIGSEVVNYFKAQFRDTMFVNMDALTYAGKAEHIQPPFDNYVLIHADICDAATVAGVLDTYAPTMILHLAAESHVDQSFEDSLKFTHTNVVGTHVLLECARRHGSIRTFIHMSTDEVYGSVDDDTSTMTEAAICKPSNPYSASKAAAEMLCNAYIMSFKMPIIIVRCNNALSRYQHAEKLVPKCIHCALSGQKIPVHGDGSSKRTFIHSLDIATAIQVIAEKGKPNEIYNIGTTHEYTVLEVIQEVLKIVHPGAKVADWVEYVPDRVYQDHRYAVDTSKLRALGWTPTGTFQDALRDITNSLIFAHTNPTSSGPMP